MVNVIGSVAVSSGVAVLILLASAGTALMAPLESGGISFGGSTVIGDAGGTVQALVAGDLDNDGDPDLVSGDGGIIAWQNSTTWISQTVGSPGGGAVAYALTIGDLDNDGNLDVVSGSSNEASYEIRVWWNNGSPFDGTWIPNDVGATGTADVNALALADFDYDGYLDIVSGDSGGIVAVWHNDGTPFMSTWTSNTVGITGTVRALAVGDVNRKGYLDIFRFELSPGAATGVYELWAEVGAPVTGSSNSASFRVTDCVLKLIVTNRTLLFQELGHWEVQTLLETVHDLMGAVYYVDDYSTEARDWDPSSVTYWDPDVNDVADEIDHLIEDWADDGRFDAPYLLLVGGDPVLPYHRVDDPLIMKMTTPTAAYILSWMT